MTARTPDLALARLVPGAAGGDREAFARLVDATSGVVDAIALAIVRDAELARDVAQDVFLAAWRDLARLREPASVLPWLRQLTRHRAYHVLRGERRRLRRVAADETETLLAAAADPRPDAADRLLAGEERRLLREVLDALPAAAREVVVLYYREGRSVEQVAGLLGLGEDAVRKRLSRARERLRSALAERFGEAARRSAPGAAFTAAVLAAVAVAAPAAAAGAAVAATGTAGAAGTLGGKPLLAKLATLLGGAAAGAAGGILGVVLGLRPLERQARDDRERRDLAAFKRTAVATVLAAAAAFPVTWDLTGSPWSQVGTFATFLATLAVLYLGWLPRIVARRHALEAAEDPERAARARRRERRAAILGWTFGILCGTAGLVAGLLLGE